MKIDIKEILFIINPVSGKKKARWIIGHLKKVDPDINFVVTRSKKDLETIFAANLEKFKVFVAVGGDGTVNEIARFLKNYKEKSLAIYPNGSGNGFARELGFGKKVKSLVEDIQRGETIDVDVLDVNGAPCINIMGVGFDSFIANLFQKSNRGLMNYIFSTAKSAFWFKPFEAKVVSSEIEVAGIFFMISIANSRQYGNNAYASPGSIPNDGVFEIILVKPFPFYLFPVLIFKMFNASLKDSKYIRFIKESELATISPEYNIYHIDGDPYISDKKLQVSIQKNCLRIIKTRNNKLFCG